jgi:hypothetical protein
MMLPFLVWRETFINDVILRRLDALDPHPEKTLVDKISIMTNPKDMQQAKSRINCTEDAGLPDRHWHPRMSQKLGMFRLVQTPGSHELCFSNPKRLALAIMDAGRD